MKAQVSSRRRSFGCLTNNDYVQLSMLRSQLIPMVKFFMAVPHDNETFNDPNFIFICDRIHIVYCQYRAIASPSRLMNGPLRHMFQTHVRIHHFPLDIFNANFRFNNPQDLTTIMNGLKFPVYMYAKSGHVFHREEVFCLGLYRLHAPSRTSIFLLSIASDLFAASIVLL